MISGTSIGRRAGIHYSSLRFRNDPGLEQAFLEDYHRRSIGQVRFALVTGIVFFAVFGILDSWTEPALKHRLWFIRYGLVIPFFAGLLLLSFSSRAGRLLQPGLGFGMVVGGLGIVAAVLIAPASGSIFAAGLMLLFMYPPFVRMRFVYAAAASLTVMVAYELAALRLTRTTIHLLLHNNFFFLSAAVIALLNAYLLELYARRNFAQRVELEEEREKADRLLLNILPSSVAEQLKGEHRNIAEGFAEATVLFADIVGFTRMSSGRHPAEVVHLLNEVFSEFDRLAEARGVEKIKTIGDAYMAAAGLPDRKPGHAEAVADLALDMRDAFVLRGTGGAEPLSLRIGINSGPVVAGVIGMKKFIYDVWGDTVNTASRMESHGLAGEIHVTRESYELLKDRFLFLRRGSVQVKGKGPMDTFLLVGRKDASAEERSGSPMKRRRETDTTEIPGKTPEA